MQNWQQYESQYQIEALLYDLCIQAIQIMAKESEGTVINGIALNVHSYYGTCGLSFNRAENGEDGSFLRENDIQPPDWSDEWNEAVYQTFKPFEEKHRYAIADIMLELENKNLDAEFEAFGNGFLYTCRRVMSRLRQNKAFEKYANISNNCWYLVTEIDADTEEEERLLEEVYQEIISTLTA